MKESACEKWKQALKLAACITFIFLVLAISHGLAFYLGAKAMFAHLMGQ